MNDAKVSVSAAAPGGLARLGLWFGLLAGALELSIRKIQWAIRPRVTVLSLRRNWHEVWMTPVADVVILGLVGIGLALLVRRWTSTRPAAIATLGSLAIFCGLIAVDGLHLSAATVLAIGLGIRIGKTFENRPDFSNRLVGRTFLPMLAVLVLCSVAAAGWIASAEARAVAGLPTAARGSPNVLLLVLDNVRAENLSHHDYDRDTTPNLARLSERAIQFDHARSPAPWTLPSHASMLTGCWPRELSVGVDRPLDDAETTLPEYLAAKGYATAGFVGNTYYCNAWYGLDRGFSRYEDFAENDDITPGETLRCSALGYRLLSAVGLAQPPRPGEQGTRKTASRINSDLMRWLSRRGSRPFFAFLNYYDAHEPFQPPPGAPRRFGLSALPEKDRVETLSAFRDLSRRPPGTSSSDPRADSAVIARATEMMRDSYDDCLAELDRQIGILLDAMERDGLLENTLVVVTSDHGEHFGERGLMGHGVSVYRPEVHVPLMIVPPASFDHRKGQVVSAPASLRDLPATIAEIVTPGAQSPFPGRSLARLWADRPEKAEPVLIEVEHQKKFAPSRNVPASLGPVASVVDQDHVYILSADGREELFDRSIDPKELTDLAGLPEHAPALARLREAFDRLRDEADAPEDRPAPNRR